jgi:hypothetical protein
MSAFSGKSMSIVSCFLVVLLGGCGSDAPKNDKKAPPTDFRKFSPTALAARIKSHQKEFTDVTLTADGTDKYKGTASTADGKKHPLAVTVTEKSIDFKEEGGTISGSIKEKDETTP